MSKLFVNEKFDLGIDIVDVEQVDSLASQGQIFIEAGRVVISKLQLGNVKCFIKKYSYTPNYRFLGRPSYTFREKHSFDCFSEMGIPHPEVIFCAENRQFGRLRWAIIGMQEIEESQNLIPFFIECKDPILRQNLILRLAEMTALMCNRRFSHGGWRMRNILIDKNHQLFCVDCPKGHFKKAPVGRSLDFDLLGIFRDFMQMCSEEEKIFFVEEYCKRTNKNAAFWKEHIAEMCLKKFKRINPLVPGQTVIC
ncbi:lipopolysaccharide kinase InaA family protein [Candidatus Uabimicrobium amorphum]|uniref:LPS biosynthesis protein n=1 Tax=Uabimicrobium amorphum TaxID=2596890 RepID=A0A5S9ILM6_UABAM|nr:lipopolysaccharide kinase InaA family protein [Candidatus Uabimicrobium amorphum]BBM84168.1 LPS biosynthesis protein [Candidatus Uabimicrobium amorphum]